MAIPRCRHHRQVGAAEPTLLKVLQRTAELIPNQLRFSAPLTLHPLGCALTNVVRSQSTFPGWLAFDDSRRIPARSRARACTGWPSRLTAAVATYLGLSVVVCQRIPPRIVTTLAAGSKRAGIRTPLHVMLPGKGASGHEPAQVGVILDAAVPGTFADLAANLAWLIARSPRKFILDPQPHPLREAARRTAARRPMSISPSEFSSAAVTPHSKRTGNSTPTPPAITWTGTAPHN
jgi:hypothetical protein